MSADPTNIPEIGATQPERVTDFINVAIAKCSVRRYGDVRLMIQKERVQTLCASLFRSSRDEVSYHPSFLPCVWSRLQYDFVILVSHCERRQDDRLALRGLLSHGS